MKARGLVAAFLGFVLVVGLAFAPQSSAQESGALNLTTSPLPINLSTEPGKTVTTELRIKNSGTRTETLQVGLLKFGANDTSGQPRLADREAGDDYFDWVRFSQDKFTAEPNVWHSITMTIDVPSEGGLGYYYAVTFQRSADASADEVTALHGGTAILVLLDVKVPHAKRQVEIAEFKASRSVYEFLPAEFSLSLKNSGNIHLIPSGSIFITKGSEEIAVLSINEARGNVLPNSTRAFAANWTDGFPSYQDIEQDGKMLKNEDGTPKRTLKWDLGQIGKLRWGKYKATLLAVYDDRQRDVPVEAVLTFWVIPWRIIFGGIFILMLLLAGPFILLRQSIRRRRGQAKKTVRTVKSDPAHHA